MAYMKKLSKFLKKEFINIMSSKKFNFLKTSLKNYKMDEGNIYIVTRNYYECCESDVSIFLNKKDVREFLNKEYIRFIKKPLEIDSDTELDPTDLDSDTELDPNNFSFDELCAEIVDYSNEYGSDMLCVTDIKILPFKGEKIVFGKPTSIITQENN